MKLVHLYPDLMNLYGDYGSLALLTRRLRAQGLEAHTLPLAPGDPIPADAALLYMGPGTEPARDAALSHLRPQVSALRAAWEAGVPILFTGNSLTLLGSAIETAGGDVLPGLGLLGFTARESWDRHTGDAVALADGLPPTVGFQNRCDVLEGVDAPLFTALELGRGNTPQRPGEGVRAGSLYATHLIGPLLVKNPHWLDRFLTLLGARPDADAETEAGLAYSVTLDALRARESR